MGVVSYDAVGPGLGQGSVGGDDIGRRKGDVFQAGVPNGDDEVAPLFGFPDKRKKPVDLPAANTGPAARSREVLAFAEVQESDPHPSGENGQRRQGFFKAEARADRSDAVPTKDVQTLSETLNAVVENVVVSQTGDLERDPGQAGDMGRQALEDCAALPNGLAGRRQRAFTVDDPQVGVPYDGQHVSVNAFGGRPDYRPQGPDRRPVAGDDDRDPAAVRPIPSPPQGSIARHDFLQIRYIKRSAICPSSLNYLSLRQLLVLSLSKQN